MKWQFDGITDKFDSCKLENVIYLFYKIELMKDILKKKIFVGSKKDFKFAFSIKKNVNPSKIHFTTYHNEQSNKGNMLWTSIHLISCS